MEKISHKKNELTSNTIKNPLITVVIPVYKVEQYINECIDSILKQSYSNLEIILVDDGSPDQCGKICDEYMKKDSRIKVIHQENKGLSGARNSATDIATGKFITYVDSDDWISEDMIKTLYNAIKENHTRIACGAFESFFEDGTTVTNNHNNETFIYSKQEALDCFLFNEYITPCVWGKLYDIKLWNNIRCPEGKLFEDQFTTYKILDLCEKVVFVTRPLYHYRKRNGSIGHSNFDKKTYQLYDAIHEEYNYISRKYGEQCPNIAVARTTWEVVFANMMISNNYRDKKVIKEIQKFARNNIKKIMQCQYISKVRKIQLLMFVYSFPIYVKFYKLYKIKHPIT